MEELLIELKKELEEATIEANRPFQEPDEWSWSNSQMSTLESVVKMVEKRIEQQKSNNVETVFKASYYINNDTYRPETHIYTSTITAVSIDDAEIKFDKWFKDKNFDYEFITIEDCYNKKIKTYGEPRK